MEHKRAKDEVGAFIEAFCFDAIMKNNDEDTYPFYTHFEKNIGLINKEIKETHPANRLLWARNTMYAKMEKEKSLQKLLEDKYASQKNILPFRLIE